MSQEKKNLSTSNLFTESLKTVEFPVFLRSENTYYCFEENGRFTTLYSEENQEKYSPSDYRFRPEGFQNYSVNFGNLKQKKEDYESYAKRMTEIHEKITEEQFVDKFNEIIEKYSEKETLSNQLNKEENEKQNANYDFDESRDDKEPF